MGAIAELTHGRCDSCGAVVKWGDTVTGGRMPVDPVPMPDGTVYLVTSGKLRALTADEVDRARKSGALLYRAHFASCPSAEHHRGVGRDQMRML